MASPRPAAAPVFALYGEAPTPGQDLLHIEEVQSRSRLYHWEIQPHVHRGLSQILWLYRGSVEARLDERREAAEGPAAIFVPSGVVHGFRFAPDSDGLVLTLSPRFAMEGEPEFAGEAFERVFGGADVLRLAPGTVATPRLDALFRELAAEFALPGERVSPATLWLARALIWRLARARVESGQGEGARAHRAQALYGRFLQLVEQHFLDRWPLERYAARLGLSTQRLNRLTRMESGRSALEIVHDRLTREACRRLLYIAAPAEKLAVELGFEDAAYFSRFFKRRTGMTPRAWREAQRASS